MTDFVHQMCGGEPYGPWMGGCFTYCFIDTTLYPALGAFFLVALLVRLYQVSSLPPNAAPLMPRLGLRLILTVALSLTALLLLAGRFLDGTLVTYDILRLSLMALSWFSLAVLFSFEASKNLASTGPIQVWIMTAFSVCVIRLQTVRTLPAPFRWEVVFTYVELALSLLLAALTWLSNGEADKLKEAAAAAESSQETVAAAAPAGSIQETTPLLKQVGPDVGRAPDRCPEETANIFSKMIFAWANPLYRSGYEKPLQQEDLWPLVEEDTADDAGSRLRREWDKELAKPREERSLKLATWRAFAGEFIVGGFYKLINDTLVFAGPLVLNLLIRFISTPEWPLWYGVSFAAGLFIASMIQTVAVNTYFFRVFRVGQRARSALITLIYQKAFDISNEGRQHFTTGEITNLMSVDSTRLQNLTPYLHMVWSSLLQVGVSLYLLYQQVGPSVFVGLAFMIFMVPLNALLLKKLSTYQKAMMVNKDRRLKLMSEILSGIRVIKFFAWEESYIEAANGVRHQEVETLRKSAYLRATTTFSWMVTPVFVAMFTFMSFTLLGHELTATIAFTSVSLFNVLRFPLNMLPNVLSNLVDANISLNRIGKYLNNDDRDETIVEWNKQGNPNEPFALQMKDATFSWAQGQPVLKNMSFQVEKGKLVALVGGVGCGKSSVLSAFLGDMERESGRAVIDGSLAYASQQAWIQNATVRDNILFGLPYNASRYRKTIDACQLASDFDILPAGDETEIGEKGINLSGGQKQRVSLARAVYANKDIYLLDDVLSAVDVHVGRAIFEKVLRGLLRGKTVFVVTHQLQYLPDVDKVIFLKQGQVMEQGSYEELMNNKNGPFYRLITDYAIGGGNGNNNNNNNNNNNGDAVDSDGGSGGDIDPRALLKASMQKDDAIIQEETKKVMESLKDAKKAPAERGKSGIIGLEEREVGRLNSHIILDYSMAAGGVVIIVVVLSMLLISTVSNVGTNVWLSSWSNDPGLLDHSLLFWLGIYTLFGVVAGITTWIRSLVQAVGGVKASYNLHKDLLRRIMRAPTAFFDATPMGRILNRFSGDIYVIDEQLPFTFGMLLTMLLTSLATLVIISFVTPLFLVLVFPLAYVYRYTQQYYIASSRELKRLDSVSRSPIYSHFTETIDGVSVVRSYGMIDTFSETNRSRVDKNQQAYFCFQLSNRWLAVRLETIGNVVVGMSALFAVFSRNAITGGLAGLSVSYALQLTGTLNWLVRQSTETETQLVSVERVIQYSHVAQEPPAELPGQEPPASWPAEGCVEFKNYKLRYREGLDLVLKGISLIVKPMEKVGIVGRTGAGKSSLVLALFRFVEAAGGSIEIDGVDISSIGTDRLRRCITIIPQDPVLFVGSVRRNLDPFEDYPDERVWDALDRVHLKEEIEAKGGLEYQVAEGGENFSVGQRQLFCMARALLRPAKILILDEATSNVDAENDALIQQTIREAFADRTVLTIAHRLNTILDSDKILVLGKGEVLEYDTPDTLLEDKDSVFYEMVNSSSND